MSSEILFEKILLLEDDESHAFLIKRALKDCVAEVEHCTSVEQALTALSSFTGDLIISDLNLPDSRGGAHVEALKRASNDIPIVVLTSSTSLDDAVEAMKQGARDFLVKNFDRDFKELLQLSLSRLYASLELERDRRRIQREMDILRISIENSSDAMAVVNSAGELSYSNRAFQDFVVYCGGKATTVYDIFSDQVSRKDELLKTLRDSLGSLTAGGIWKGEVSLRDKPENAFDMGLSAVVEQGSDTSSVAQYVLWVRDISEQKSRERFQREILSTTTHDLKGPLGAIMISTEILGPMLESGSKASQLVLRIASSAQGSLNLIDEFLSARRIEEGSFILKPIECDVVGVIREAMSDYTAIAAARDLKIELITEQSQLNAKVDKLGLARVVGNLLSNAVKFSGKGGCISVKIEGGPEEYRICVEDSGCGMEASEVQRIFDRFSRLEKHSGIKGSGIGLYVVKSIVTAHSGRITVTSKPGKGTKFELALPILPPVNARGELYSLDFK